MANSQKKERETLMKLAIQIPCYNEEAVLTGTLDDLPRPGSIDGVDEMVIVIIDDGCSDRTVEVAREWSVRHEYPMVIAHHTRNRGLAAAFQTGLNTGLALKADIIVNTDADNQYPGHYIPELVQPILQKQADLVIADRQTDTIEHFSPIKKRFQKWGSLTVRIFSGSKVPDAVSGFRAFSREAALSMNVVTRYTYTVETIFQASKKNLAITSIPIVTNPVTRESRLVKGIWNYTKRMGATIIRFYAMHEPLKAFFYFSIPFFVIGFAAVGRFLFFALTERGGSVGHIQSLLLGSACVIIGFLILLIGLIADLISSNRRLVEDALFRIKKMELEVEQSRNREDEMLAELRALRQNLIPNAPAPVVPAPARNGYAKIHLPDGKVEEIQVEEVKLRRG
jgi:glycosyltransferase involved in cell wall biosynthesis